MAPARSGEVSAVVETGRTAFAQKRARFERAAVELSDQRSTLASKLEGVMSVIDRALKSNEQYAKAYDPRIGAHPQPAIAVVTCLDPRLSNLEGILGLKHADIAAAVRPSRTKCCGNLSLRRKFWGRRRSCILTTPAADLRPLTTRNRTQSFETDARWIASSRAFPLVQGSGRAHEGTDQKGEVAFLDRQGSACERLHFRRRHRAASGK